MAQVRFTKNELRDQQLKLTQLDKYLPTLQLKKAMLQAEVDQVQLAIDAELKEKEQALQTLEPSVALLTEKYECHPLQYTEISHVEKTFENIAGVEIPVFKSVQFVPMDYSTVTTPAWLDSLVVQLQALVTIREKARVLEEKKRALEYELREVSIRVNLFEKVLIPRCKQTIKKIKLFLGEQQLVAVAQAKVAKTKILARKEI